MRKFIVSLMSAVMLCVAAAGCADKATSKTETEVTTPGGKTTVTTTKEIKQSGENPPLPANR
jgi:hypothetical protein